MYGHTRSEVNGLDRDDSPWLAYAAALWALIFGLLHGVWATGWYIGLDRELARKAFARPWFLAYDLAVVVMCLLAVWVALALVRPWGRRVPRWALGVLAWGGTGLLMWRAIASIVQLLYQVATGSFVARAMLVWEVWFYLGAILFGLSTWMFWTVWRKPSVAGS
ncbi:MAG: DUF3995 domain-containing protein [Acidobacteriota bacterium]